MVCPVSGDLAYPLGEVVGAGACEGVGVDRDDFEAAGFVDTFRTKHPDMAEAYTWWTHWANARARNIGWRIDYWLASKGIADRIVSANIHPDVLGSDHCPVSIEIADE